MQVKNSCSLFSKRTKYAALLVLPSPSCCLAIVSSCAHSVRALLLLCGDIEENPGPTTRASQTTNDVMSVLSEIQSGQASILNEMKSIRATLLQHEKKYEEITKRLCKIENDCSVLATVNEKVDDLQKLTEQNCGDITSLVVRMDGSEDRQRRSNLVFYGFQDASDETWAQSEKRVIDLCLSNLEVPLQSRDIERAHRIGRFQPSKNRPIIVRFCHYKDRELILSNAKKLKGTNYSVSEDFSPNTRKARKHLIQFGKASRKSYKLRHDKLTIDGTTYVFDGSSESVIPHRP